MTITNSTISNNTSEFDGGAIDNWVTHAEDRQQHDLG